MPQLRPYQLEAVKDVLEKKRVLIADDMGLGKCAEAISAKTALESRSGYDIPTLITCPSAVMEHWTDEVRLWYKKKEDSRIVQINSSTYDRDVKRARNSDVAIIGYPTLSYFGGSPEKISMLGDSGFRYGIIDEAHNAKNPDSMRSMAVKNLYDGMDNLAILTGTPVPNTVIDLYMLLSLLEPKQFPVHSENVKPILSGFYTMFRNDPEFVRRVLNERMLRRTIEDYLREKVPELRQRTVNVGLDGEHLEVYRALYDNDEFGPSRKLIELQKAAIDPNLVNPQLLPEKLAERLGRMESSMYSALDEVVERTVDEGGKILVFSNLRQGVTDKLKSRWAKYGALIVDGDDKHRAVEDYDEKQELSKREFIRKRFQQDPDTRVLIATTVMDEGVDLTAATDIAHLGLPYTPAAFDQRNRRSQRIGDVQKDYVNVHVLKATLNGLTPTIHEGLERLLSDKRRIVTFLLKEPFSLTQRDLDEIKNGHVSRSRNIAPLLNSPSKSVISHFGQLRGQGGEKILRHYDKYPEEAEYIAKLYTEHWDGFYGGNTANLYTRLIKKIAEHDEVGKKVDIASGPFSLSRRLGEPVVNVDLNQHMLNAGRYLEEQGRIVKGNVAHQGLFHDLSMLQDGEFDLALCSLAMHMSKLEAKHGRKTVPERELVFREQNRVLREGGYSIVALPHTVIRERNLPQFNEGLQQLGFEVLPFSGFYKGPEDSSFKVYMGCFRKVEAPQSDKIDPQLLTWRMDEQAEKRTRRSKEKRKHAIPETKPIEKKFIEEFRQVKRGKVLTIDDLAEEVWR